MTKSASGLSPASLRTAVQRAESVPELKQIVDYAQTAVEACKRTRQDIIATNEYAIPALEAVIKAGGLLAGLGRSRGGDPSVAAATIAGASPYREALDESGLQERTAQYWQKVHEHEHRKDEYLARAQADEEIVSWRGLLGTAHVENAAGENEWYTPTEYVEAARRVMGGIDLDPASTAVANEVVGAITFYDIGANGLSHDWGGRVWMNPPYARPLVDEFCAKLAESYSDGGVSQACVLTNNATETGWFHALAEVASGLCFPRGRVKFWHPERESAPLQGQAVIYLGSELDAFCREFVQFGFTARVA